MRGEGIYLRGVFGLAPFTFDHPYYPTLPPFVGYTHWLTMYGHHNRSPVVVRAASNVVVHLHPPAADARAELKVGHFLQHIREKLTAAHRPAG
eukprot:6817002-Pyramimonas_sp.AAC.1